MIPCLCRPLGSGIFGFSTPFDIPNLLKELFFDRDLSLVISNCRHSPLPF